MPKKPKYIKQDKRHRKFVEDNESEDGWTHTYKHTEVVDMPIATESELILPEFFARKIIKKGKISYKLVNPMTKTRNLSSRGGEPVIKLTRRPVEHIVLDEENQEIPIDLFPKKDRDMIRNHFDIVHHNKRLPFASDVPESKPFKNKTRGRPTHLPKNIAYHKANPKEDSDSDSDDVVSLRSKIRDIREKIVRLEDEKNSVEEDYREALKSDDKKLSKSKKKRYEELIAEIGRLSVEANILDHRKSFKQGRGLEEGHKAIIKEVRDLKKILVNHIKTAEKVGGNTPVSHQEITPHSHRKRELAFQHDVISGDGVISSITNLGKKVYKGAKNTASKIASTAKDVATKVITGNTGMPPNVKSMLDKYGDSIITDMTIARNPVGSALISALSVASMGEFKKNLDNSPYDKLFHLKLIITLQNGIKLALEKVERVSLTKYTKPVKGQEDENVPVDKQITLGQLYHNAEMAMGDRFYPYSARDNNCQNFILSVLKASGIGGERDYAFIKQDTQSLFGDESFLRKLSNTVTDIGARFNVLLQGGKIKKGRGRKVFPPDHKDKDFISLPNYLQSDALAGNIVLGDNNSGDTPDDGESGTGIEKGAFRKSFYQRQAKYKHIKTLDAYARYIVEHPSDFSMKVRRRAQFLINVH